MQYLSLLCIQKCFEKCLEKTLPDRPESTKIEKNVLLFNEKIKSKNTLTQTAKLRKKIKVLPASPFP